MLLTVRRRDRDEASQSQRQGKGGWSVEVDDDVAQYPEDPPLWLGAGIGRGPECDDRDRND